MQTVKAFFLDFDRRGLLWKCGVAGSGIIALASLITALFYDGRLGEAYSPLNHFVSELGEVGVSQLAWVFNAGLLVGGLCLVVFLAGVGARIGGWPGLLFAALGLACGISGTLVGAFPMNNLPPHIFWATNFFDLGLLSMLVFSLIVLFTHRGLPKALAIPGLLAAAAFAAFVYWPQPSAAQGSGGGDALSAVNAILGAPRPTVWTLAVFEWLAVGSVLVWALILALAVRGMPRRS